jgi:hypothetical protein
VLLISAGAALVAFEAWVRTMSATLQKYDVADYQRKPADLGRRGVPDIILMGSSRAKYALVPDEFARLTGRRAYNLGIAGTKVAEWQILARQVFLPRRPRLVVLGINASEVRADYVPTEAAKRLFDLPDWLESLRIDGWSLPVAGAFLEGCVAPLCESYHRRYELRMWAQEKFSFLLPKHAQASRELRRRVAAPCPEDGFEHPWREGRRLRTLDQQLLENPVAREVAGTPLHAPDAPALRRLGRLLDWFAGQSIPVIVAYLPNSPETEARWRHVEPDMIAAIHEVCRRSGVPFLGAPPADLPRTNRDFMEEVHVGLPLARRISGRIAQEVLAVGMLPADRSRLAGAPAHEAGD